jgi:EmrB/QacA subfamily drug resistance transporter
MEVRVLLSAKHARSIALLVAGAFFMEMLDGTVIATAMPQMADSFGVEPVDLNIGMSAYILTAAVLIPASGWVADRFGARIVFVVAIAIFTIASILCGLSNSLPAFTAARILQGVGGAMMVPVGRLVVLKRTDKQDLMRAVAIITWPGLVAPILAPPLGGFITTYASWRWIFFLNVPLGLAGLLLAILLLGSDRGEAKPPFDWKGFALTGLACFGLMYVFDGIGRQEIHWLEMAGALLASLAVGFAAIRHAQRRPDSLVDFHALRVRTFAVTILGGSAFRVAISAVPFLLPLMFQLGFGLDAYRSGLLVLAVFAGNLAMKPGTTAVLKRFGFRRTMVATGIINVVMTLACAFLFPDTPTAIILAVLFLGGMSRSMQFTTINTLAFADIEEDRMSGANTLFTMVQQITIGMGIAFGAIALRLGMVLHSDGSGVPTMAAFHLAFGLVGLVAVAALIDVIGLPSNAGAEMSGHGTRARAGVAARDEIVEATDRGSGS